jgi:hypothetical protein
MTTESKATTRCAIYTRKSSEEGLEQSFNSLDAQREACEAFIASQRHEGWRALPALYDDGGYSGGNLERPALKSLLGQPENQRNKTRDLRLPTAPELFPELINAKLDKKDRLPPCSALEALERQEPFVNQTLACQALAMLARLFRYGRLSYHGGFVNLRTGRTTSLAVDSVLWQRMRTQPTDYELPRRNRGKVVRP